MAEQCIYKLKIDTSFKKLIPQLPTEEFLLLEKNIIKNGCCKPLFVWNSTILDGHNRYEICTKLQIPFMIQRIYFKNQEEAIAWICVNQLSRPNITEENRRYLIGKRCEIEKILGAHNASGTNQYTKKELKASILPKLAFDASASQTRERLSKEYNLSQASILNYEKYTQALDSLSKVVPNVVPRILTGKIKVSLENTIAFSQLSASEIRELCQLISDDCKEFSWKLRQILFKKQNISETDSLQIPAFSIKEMPVYDPDAEISSLILTIPSWISSINRAYSTADLNGITDNAYHNLEKGLTQLRETVNNMLTALKEVN